MANNYSLCSSQQILMILWDWSGKYGLLFGSWYEPGSSFPPFLIMLFCNIFQDMQWGNFNEA